MMKISTTVILISVSIFYCLLDSTLAQAPDTLWTKTYGGIYDDRCYSIELTNDGGIVFVGTNKVSFLGDYDLWMVKTNSDGDTLWSKRIGDQFTQIGYSIKETVDGGFIIVGLTHNNNNSGVLIVRTNSLGDTLS